MCFDTKPIYIWWKVNTKYVMITPHLPISLKNFQYPNHIIRHDMAYYSDRFGSPISGTPSSWRASTHRCTWTYIGVASNPPFPHKNFEAQLLLRAKLQYIMCFDTKANIYLVESQYKYMVVTPHLPTSLKKFQYPNHITRHDMAYYSDRFGSPISGTPSSWGGQNPRWVHLKNLYLK